MHLDLAAALFGCPVALAAGASPMSSLFSRAWTVEMDNESVGHLIKANLEGNRELVRCHLNVPLDG